MSSQQTSNNPADSEALAAEAPIGDTDLASKLSKELSNWRRKRGGPGARFRDDRASARRRFQGRLAPSRCAVTKPSCSKSPSWRVSPVRIRPRPAHRCRRLACGPAGGCSTWSTTGFPTMRPASGPGGRSLRWVEGLRPPNLRSWSCQARVLASSSRLATFCLPSYSLTAGSAGGQPDVFRKSRALPFATAGFGLATPRAVLRLAA